MSYKFQKGDAKLGGAIEASQLTGTLKPSSLSDTTTDDIAEGSSAQYYTDARARGAVSITDAGGDGSMAYDSGTGVFTYTGPSAAEVRAHLSAGDGLDVASGEFSLDLKAAGGLDIQSTELSIADLGVTNAMLSGGIASGKLAELNAFDTDALSEGSSNQYFTSERARKSVSVVDAGGDGSLTYVSGTGVFTYTGPSASEVRAHFSGGEMIDISSGEVAINAGEFSASSDVRFDAKLAAADTGDLSEGSNLYYTDARVRAAVSADGDLISFDSSTGAFSTVAANVSASWDVKMAAADSDDLSEGASNLYYTDARARAAVSADGDLISYDSSTGAFSTVAANVSASWDVKMAAADTGDLSEGSNLYYTDARVHAAVSAGPGLGYDGSGEFSIPSGNVTNAMLSGAIENAKLVNDSVTLTAGAGMAAIGEVDLGASITVAVDGVLEDLDTLGAPASDGQFIVATGAGAFAYEDGDTARTSLGLGTGDTPSFSEVSASNGFATNGVVQAGEVQASTFSGDSVAVTGITGSLNNALSAGDGIVDFTYDNGDGPKTVALDLKSDDGLQIDSGQLAVKVDNRSFSLTAGSGVELASGVAGEGLSLSAGVLSVVHTVTDAGNSDFNVAYGVNFQSSNMTGPVTASLPAVASGDEGKTVIIKVRNADQQTVRVQADGSQNIDGSGDDLLIESSAGAVTLVALSAAAGWAII
jgi:hypothetical protein